MNDEVSEKVEVPEVEAPAASEPPPVDRASTSESLRPLVDDGPTQPLPASLDVNPSNTTDQAENQQPTEPEKPSDVSPERNPLLDPAAERLIKIIEMLEGKTRGSDFKYDAEERQLMMKPEFYEDLKKHLGALVAKDTENLWAVVGQFNEQGEFQQSPLQQQLAVESGSAGSGPEELINQAVNDQLWQQFLNDRGQEFGLKSDQLLDSLGSDHPAKVAYEDFRKEQFAKLSNQQKNKLWLALAEAGLAWYKDGLANSSMDRFLDGLTGHAAWGAAWHGASTNKEGNERQQAVQVPEFISVLKLNSESDAAGRRKKWLKLMSFAKEKLPADWGGGREHNWENQTSDEDVKKAMGKLMACLQKAQLTENKDVAMESVNSAFEYALKEVVGDQTGFTPNHYLHSDVIDMFYKMATDNQQFQAIKSVLD